MLMLVALVSVQAEPLRFYVSPQGNDSWSGKLARPNARRTDGPFATLHRAQRAVREAKTQGAPQPIEVIVSAGTYYLNEPLVFTPDDSGSSDAPITYRAARGAKVVLSGGVPLSGWRRIGGNLWSVRVPEPLRSEEPPRLLRLGNRWAVRARHPNLDPQNPLTGGWLFADFHGERWERGVFGQGVGNIHNVGDTLVWRIRVPESGRYRLWLRYAADNVGDASDMSGRCAVQVDDGIPIPLRNLANTGGWGQYCWSLVAELELQAGERTLRWKNLQGGGLNLDALVLVQDTEWNPEQAIGDFQWWGAFRLDKPKQGHLILIQAEACDEAIGREVTVAVPQPPGSREYLVFREGDIPRWSDLSGAELHIFPAWGWVNAIAPIVRIDYDTRRVLLPPDGYTDDIRLGNRYFISGVREALDAPDEWYLDRERGELLYLSEGDNPPAEPAVLARLDRLIVLQGEPERNRWVEHLRLEGFTFMDTNYTLTTNYYMPADAVIWMSGARNCVVTGCTFRWTGGYALRLEERSERIQFVKNRVEDVAQGGVILIGDNASQPRRNLIAGNLMQRLGLVYKHVAGVYVITGSDNRIAHNTIWDTPRYAVSLKSLDDTRSSHRNVVEFNDLRRTNLETNDTGAIETLGRDQKDSGNIIRYNLILDSVGMISTPDGKIVTPYFTWGIYLDDYSSGTTVFGNIVARTVNGGVCVHGGRNNLFQNNIFVDASVEQIRLQPRDDFMQGNRFLRNIVVYSNPEALLIFSWDDRLDRFAEWDYNLYWLRGADLRTVARRITPLGTLEDWRKAGFDARSLIADPLFVASERDDYRLRPGSPAWQLGFEAIPVERIGHRGWRE
ncbi:MAG: right-handed parallel beta-helix repeat-containing protein [bacterium]|nr:right-handed parallel beta-helix repeat-containing protein [bacterium]